MKYINIFSTLFFFFLFTGEYSFNKFSLFLFFISSLIFLNYSFREKSSFIDKFSGIFFFLCFWINYSTKMFMQIFFENDGHFFLDGIGSFEFNNENLNTVFFICGITYFSISLVSFLREKFFTYKKNIFYSDYSENLKKIYNHKKILILCIFIIFLILISYINVSNSFFLRGTPCLFITSRINSRLGMGFG